MYRLFSFKIAYNGSRFWGFQRQPDLYTVEQVIFESLEKSLCADGTPPQWYSYVGRTDRGVHAIGQTVSMLVREDCDYLRFFQHMEELSDSQILPWAYRWIDSLEFKARYWSLWREYVYVDEIRNYNCQSLGDLKKSVKEIEGRKMHNYAYRGVRRFSKEYFFRRILAVDARRVGSKIVWRFRGESFPHNFIRRIIWIARALHCGESIIETSKIRHQGTAEPNRLFLVGAKHPISLIPIYEKIELYQVLASRVFRRESSDLRLVFSSYENDSSPYSLL